MSNENVQILGPKSMYGGVRKLEEARQTGEVRQRVLGQWYSLPSRGFTCSDAPEYPSCIGRMILHEVNLLKQFAAAAVYQINDHLRL